MALDLQETWELPEYALTFNTGVADALGNFYWVTEDSGWRGGAAPRPNRQDKSYANGQFRRPNFSSGLVVSWNGYVLSPTAHARASAERKLASIGRDPYSLFTVVGTDSVGPLYSMMELDGPAIPNPLSLTDLEFSMQFGSNDPNRYVYGTQMSGTTTLPDGAGGLDWVTGGGLDWVTGGGLNWGSATSSGQIFFNNTGTAASWATWTVSAGADVLVKPTITSSTGKILRYNATLQPGDMLVLSSSPFNRFATLNGSTDVMASITPAQWFSLATGASSVTFSADNANPTATLLGTAPIAGW